MKRKNYLVFLLCWLLIGALIGFLLTKLPKESLSLPRFSLYNFSFGFWGIDILIAFLASIFAFYFQIIIHEAGHLVMGLLTGYKFVSFRIGSLMLIRENSRFKWKKYSIPGTMGQCLMDPPTLEQDSIPFKAYNIGGVLFNFISAAIAALILFSYTVLFPLNIFLLLVFIFGLLFGLLNGIPMKMSGIANDAKNITLLNNDPISRRSFVLQLKMNAWQMQGIRFRDMPEEYFVVPADANFNNYFHVSIKLLEIGRYLDQLQFKKASCSLNELKPYLSEMIGIYRYETKCELIFFEIIFGNSTEKIEELYTPEIKKYVNLTHKYMLNKKRLLYTYALWVEKDRIKAESLLKEIRDSREKFPLKGELEAELEIMEYVTNMEIADKNTIFKPENIN